MSNHRDRAVEMQFVIDEHVKAVLEFMQENVPASKLIGVAESVPQMARLLWDRFQQEPFSSISLHLDKPAMSGRESQSLSVAT